MTIANNAFFKILKMLDGMKQLPPQAMQTAFDKWVARIAAVCRWTGVALFAILLGFAGWVKFVHPIQGGWLTVALFIGIATTILALLSLVVDIIPAAVMLVRFKHNSLKRLILEIEHDSTQARKLLIFDRQMLERTDAWLSIQIARIRDRLGFFLGGADKVAILALGSMGWATLNTLKSLQNTWQQNAFLYGAAFLGGLAIGGVMLNVIVQRYTYQRDLLALALDLIDQHDELDRRRRQQRGGHA
ncbi:MULTISPECIES: hypothetical protein [Burkholderia]|uniref:hypothetical protein n=1 Tax=Burkholderia TaxID=32008 RepID=UPI00064F804B|nr:MULTISPECIES: hypothetical protein [Burkholderia]KML05978.1 hypothetical protein VL00_28750 [Burkholderia cepacia]KML40443.1 hypothetical protein VL13_15940 [Burkholderia lata]KMN60008.1 hypothetical protein VK92_13775 [Burkholderia sp. LK4]KWF89058.1 hypothetical protein WL94_00325 [Burkholderia cepacia]